MAAVRRAVAAGVALVAVGCSGGTPKATPSTSASSTTTEATVPPDPAVPTTAPGSCARIPDEPTDFYAADGTSPGPNVLREAGVVRSDLTTSFGPASGVAKGVALTVEITVVDATPGRACAPIPGAAVYVWSVDVNGQYSLYDRATIQENYLRGVQVAGADGTVRFTTRFPAAKLGEWPHVGVDVFPDAATATSAGRRLASTAMAFPREAAELVYATEGYAVSGRAIARTSLAGDPRFGDGVAQQLATVTGNVAGGLVARLRVPVVR
jgi:protocatechuate 3,4-dioxygenase beta subunit